MITELAIFVLVDSLVRLVMFEANRRPTETVERFSLVDALRWLQTTQPGLPLSKRVGRPHCTDRAEPRFIERRP